MAKTPVKKSNRTVYGRSGQVISGGGKPKTSSSGGGSSKVGLDQSQINMLKGMKGIDQGALNAYVKSGAAKSVKATDIGNQTAPVIPDKPVPTSDFADMLGVNNATVIPQMSFTADPNASEITNATNKANADSFNMMGQVANFLKPKQNEMSQAYQDTYGISEKQAQRDLQKAQREQATYSAQLNTITANRDANILKLEGQGRGISDVIIGGQQAKINREAAIQALPVQAQLAAAQGNLEIAQSHVDQLFKMKINDIQTENTYRTNVGNMLMSWANSSQQNSLNAAIADSNARAAEKTQNLNLANQWAQTAIQTGQSTLAGKMMALDTKSPTFQADLAALQGKIQVPVATSGGGSSWELKDVNGETMWVNKNTQEMKPVGAGSNNPKTLSYEDNAKFNSTPEAKAVKDATSYAEAVKNYKQAISDYGTGEVFGKGKGILNEAYSSLVGATKDYYTLGTYDNGVQKLISLGIPEPSIWGLKTNRLGALDSALSTAKDKIQRNISQLESTKFGNSVEFKTMVKNATSVVGETPTNVVNWNLFNDNDLLELQQYGLQVDSLGNSSTDSVSSYYQ